MNAEKALCLFDALTGVREDYIQEALPPEKARRRLGFRQIAPIAALLCLAVGLGWFLTHAGGNSTGPYRKDRGPGDSYASYAGPVLPLTAPEGSEGLNVRRETVFDLSPLLSDPAHTEYVLVQDGYTLENTGTEDETLTLLYPFTAALFSDGALLPEITAEGARVDAELLPGTETDGAGRVLSPRTWDEYYALLRGGHAERSMEQAPVPDRKVIVYEITDMFGQKSEGKPFPNLALSFTMDPAKTGLLDWGFNGGANDRETGQYQRHLDIPQPGMPDYGKSAFLMVLGEDIADVSLKAYSSGWLDTPAEDAGGTLTRYEADFSEMLARCMELRYRLNYETMLYDALTPEAKASLICARLALMGYMGEDFSEAAQCPMEDVLGPVLNAPRILYLRFRVTVPAGESVKVTAEMRKDLSFDYGAGLDSPHGLDLLTGAEAGDLRYAEEAVVLQGADGIKLLWQNFGFDPKEGRTRVILSPDTPRYYLDLVKKSEKDLS